MASYFETGSAADVNDLLGKIRTAMAANGWTVNYNDFAGTTGGMRCHMSKGGMTVNLRTGFNNEIPVANTAERTTRQGTWSWNYNWYVNGYLYWRPSWLALNVGTGVDLAYSWQNQPGAPGFTEGKGMGVMITAASTISRYWLFVMENPDAVFVVAETRANKFEHLAFGRLILAQSVEAGGEFFAGSRRISQHYAGVAEPCYGNTFDTNGSTAFARLVDSRWTKEDQVDGWNHSLFTPAVPNSYGPNAYWATVGIPTMDSNQQSPDYYGFPNAINRSYIDDEGRSILFPIAVWKGMSGAGGLTLLGHVPHIARTSMQAYVAGDTISGVGETYLAFPNHMRTSPWSITDFGANGGDPANEHYNFYGTGIAIRRP